MARIRVRMPQNARALLVASLLAVFAATLLWAADGPLTPLMNLRTRTDANGYLRVSGGVFSGADGPLTPMANLRGRTDQNGYLRVSLDGGSITGPVLLPNGTVSAPALAFTAETDNGFYRPGASKLCWVESAADRACFDGSGATWDFAMAAAGAVRWGTTAGSADVWLFRDAAAVLALKNGATAQAFRVYGTTTGPKYVSLSHDGTNGILDTAASSGLVSIAPTNATGVQIGKPMSLLSAAVSVANVGANSCGTSAATIAGSNNAFVITVGATSGTQCRVAFTVAAATEWNCTSTDSTTTIATRTTPVDTTHTDFFGAFVAGDKVTGICFAR